MKKVFCIVISVIMILSMSLMSYAYTVDDVRYLVGKDRVDMTFTDEEIRTIINQYKAIESQNAALRLFELGKEINLNNSSNYDVEEEYNKLLVDVEDKQDALSISFQNGEDINSVFKAKSDLESSLYKLSTFKDFGYNIEVEFLDNTWTEKYYEVQDVLSKIGAQFNLGSLGSSLQSPVSSGFQIRKLFGTFLDASNILLFHNGIDLYAGDGEVAQALWNGIVSNVYSSEKDGIVIEVSHGEDLKTVYKGLKNSFVEIGNRVKQYQSLGVLGKVHTDENVYLHLSILLDEEYINPMFLFGENGLKALKGYVSYHYEYYNELVGIEDNLREPSTEYKYNDEGLREDPFYFGDFGVPYDRKSFIENKQTFIDKMNELEEVYKARGGSPM